MNVFVTLLVPTVVLLASTHMAVASTITTTSANTQTASSTTALAAPVAPAASNYNISMSVTRSTNLIDFQDGSRSDTLDYSISPSLKTSYGSFATSITYSQNLRDQYSRTASDWGDVPLSFSFKPTTFKLLERNAKLSYSITAVLPLSQYSVKKDQLRTAISGRIGFALMPDGNGFGYSAGISLGRSIHSYEEDINGSVLNQYSSNQTLAISYGLDDWSFSVDFANRTRLTYRNSVKSTFDISEEVSYSVNRNIQLAVGHTNAGSTLKPNGTDSNIDLYNENNSSVYASLGLNY